MSKVKEVKTQLDKDLEELYKRASKPKVQCPKCQHEHEGQPDFSEMAKAIELRINYEKIKNRGGSGGKPAFFEDDENGG